MAAPGTKIDTMIERPVVDGLGREGRASAHIE
jgi:hypothetical protein